ncbi:MAG: YezD family protein [Coriobacteriia bacterium]|nr:YezD family protein [Coriobacteriia bacterium]
MSGTTKQEGSISDAEQHLLEMIRGLRFGEIRIIVQDSKPVRAEEIRKSVLLGQNDSK